MHKSSFGLSFATLVLAAGLAGFSPASTAAASGVQSSEATIANDLSARDFTKRPKVSDTSPFKYDWVSQKSFDGACPVGPWIVPASDIGDPQKIAARTQEYEESFLSPFVAAERGYIDDVIMPHATRRRIARALALLRDKQVELPARKHDNLPL